MWGGPVVAVSTKDDLCKLITQRRWGPKALIDLRKVTRPIYPEGIVPMYFDPTTALTSPVDALALAETIMQMATVGLGSNADQVSDGGVWESQAAGPLAAFLYAASPQGCGGGMEWVLEGVDNIDPEDTVNPGWVTAAALCRRYHRLTTGMQRIMTFEARQRDSVAITMRKAITPWLRMSLLHTDHPVTTAFDPAFLDDPTATLFVLAPSDGTTAGAAVTLLDSLVLRWRDKTSSNEQMHRLLMVIDELPNTAPIPTLSKIVGEGRGLGLNLMAAVQASCQLDVRYGPKEADELRAIFPASLIMYGARERELLQAGEDWSPMTTRRTESYGQADGHKGLNSELGPGMNWKELMPPNPEHARLLIRGGVGTSVAIPDWTEFRRRYDAAVDMVLREARSSGARRSPQRTLAALARSWGPDRPAAAGDGQL
jgi:type IV secretion system protein VirD4